MTKPYDACRVTLGRPLSDALHSLEASALGIVLVEDAAGRMAGTLTDGDVRRALLAGGSLASPIDGYIQPRFVSVQPAASRADSSERYLLATGFRGGAETN